VRALGPSGVTAIGNGANDVGMLREAELGIAVLGHEGLAREAAEAADVLVASVHGALDLLLRPKRLLATLRVLRGIRSGRMIDANCSGRL
jgi:soluble P-type ATPase